MHLIFSVNFQLSFQAFQKVFKVLLFFIIFLNMDALKNSKSGEKCCVSSCNVSRRHSSNVKLFNFPKADTVFGQIWREKCHIPEQDFNKKLLICEKHFSQTYIGKRKLKAEAIPTLHLDEESGLSVDDFQFPPTPKRSFSKEGNCSKCGRKNNIYKKYATLQKRYRRLLKTKRTNTGANRSSKNAGSKFKVLSSLIDSIDVGDETKTFCKLLLSTRPRQYSESVKNLALNIYYVSSSTYNFLRNRLHLNLPHFSTLNRWAPIKFLQPGLQNSAMESLQHKFKSLRKEDADHMVLLLDEMAIRKDLKYNSHLDLVDGFEVKGLERTKNIGSQVCVFLLKSLYSNWSTVFNYFISMNGLTADDLSTIIKENLTLLASLGVQVRVVVCDQGSSNRKCFSLLGVTIKSPFFEFQQKKVYCIYDFPHLLKSLRNGWLQCDLITPDGNVSFKVIQQLWEKERNSRTKMCPKLTQQHIFPNSFEKMRVKLATQIFSRTVQAAIRTVLDTVGFNNIDKETALSTANFIQNVDRIFDCMNSGQIRGDNFYRSAIQLNNVPHKFIKDFTAYLNGVQFSDKKKRVYFLDGMKMTLNSVLLLVDDFLNENSEQFFILTKSINQDKLENTFSVLRQKGGNNNNPSVAELNNLLARIMSTKIIQSSSLSNCEILVENIDVHDDNESVSTDVCTNVFNTTPNGEKISQDFNFDDEIYSNMFLEDVFENSAELNLELNSMRYFIGFVAYKMIAKIDCSKCLGDLRKEDEVLTAPSEFFLFHKNYQSISDFGNLVAPSDLFMEISKRHIMIFHNIFQTQPHMLGIKKFILEQCKALTPEWFTDECSGHRLQVLDYLILILIRKHCCWTVNKMSSKKRKLAIIQS